MAVETGIEGSPASIRNAADWLAATLAPAVARGTESLLGARRAAASDWRGETGEAFCGAMSRAVTEVDHVEAGVRDVRATFVDHADTLELCQARMAAIRDEARGAGLTVAGTTILPPDDGPAHPGTPPEALSPGRVDAWNARVAAYDAHQEKIRAYNRLAERAEEVWRDLERSWERVSAKDRAMDDVGWSFQAAGVAGGLGGAVLKLHGSILRDSAVYFGGLARTNLERLRATPRVLDAARHYDDLDHYARMGSGAADDLARADRFLRAGKTVPLATGGLLTGVGIWYDLEHGGESAEQAITSNVGGFAASVAAGAAVGTVVGGPVGTVAGMVVGAGVGVFTSGMVDGLWDSGGDIDDAVMAGLDALGDTGGSLVEGAADIGGAVVDGIGGLFD